MTYEACESGAKMAEHELPLRFYNPSAFAFDTEMVIGLLADIQIRNAIERGEFDNLPGAGKPLDLPDHHDPDWWLKNLLQREGLVMLPPSIELRKKDAALDEKLDRLPNEAAVRREVEEFNERVIWARHQLPAGPPLITMPREVEATMAAWADRKAARAQDARRKEAEEARARAEARMNDRKRRGLFRRRTRRQSPHNPQVCDQCSASTDRDDCLERQSPVAEGPRADLPDTQARGG